MSTPVVTCCHLWHSVGCPNHQAYYMYIPNLNRNTCIQVPRFFSEEKISGLRRESNPHLHISGVMLYQLSYQALLGARWWGVGYTSVVPCSLDAMGTKKQHLYTLLPTTLLPAGLGSSTGRASHRRCEGVGSIHA